MASSLDAYMKDAGRRKLLTREEEVILSKKIEKGDKNARDIMIESNLRLAISIAKMYYKSGCNMQDLIQESNIGLMKAVDRFDWRRGFKFSTYASWWIRQSVSRYVSMHKTTVRVPSHAAALGWKIKKLVAEYEQEMGVRPTNEEIAEALNVTISQVETSIDAMRFNNMLSIDGGYGDDESDRSLLESIEDDRGRPIDDELDLQTIRCAIIKSLSRLSKREEQVIRLRFGISEVESEEEFEVDKNKENIK